VRCHAVQRKVVCEEEPVDPAIRAIFTVVARLRTPTFATALTTTKVTLSQPRSSGPCLNGAEKQGLKEQGRRPSVSQQVFREKLLCVVLVEAMLLAGLAVNSFMGRSFR
jgi:hypothetical protein